MKRALPFAAAVLLSACDGYHYHYGRFLAGTHQELRALAHLEAFIDSRPEDIRSAELRVVAGKIYARERRCLEARRHFEAAARQFPKLQPWRRLAEAGIMDCPDFFPLGPVRVWTYGDSASGGKAARIEATLKGSDGAAAVLETAVYAGAKKIRSDEARYEKRDWGVWEKRGGEESLILRYPFRAGASWRTTRGGETLEYRVEKDDVAVKTVAGAFTGCLKVREYNRKYPETWKYDYFAPFIGRVKTTVAGPDYENPNTELIKYTP
jgi:hypothetical protein